MIAKDTVGNGILKKLKDAQMLRCLLILGDIIPSL